MISLDEEIEVWSWRFEQLQKLGIRLELADSTARDFSVDWHVLEDLVRRGCTPELAVQIVA